MGETVEKIRQEALIKVQQAETIEELRGLSVRYLGRKGALTRVLRQLQDLPVDERRAVGQLANRAKRDIVLAMDERREEVQRPLENASVLESTWPGSARGLGHLHPVTQQIRIAEDIFCSMGFEVVTGPELESPKYNFDLLNIPKDHPARDEWDTFYIEGELLLRTHTSPVQLRAMEKRKPPVRLIVPGRVFRHEATDPGHDTMFYHLEGLVIDRGVSAANLMATLKDFLRAVFQRSVEIRFRPSFFPFVEPGYEVDMQCQLCGGTGCSVCKQTGWVELLGAGTVHPTVLRNMGVDPREYSGFAFGIGMDRLMMLRHGVNDIRLLYSGDLRFLEQF
ncbi:MAG: phenylalanine--tRNA ligase subunit alpha [Patescibacteria group bacterium]|nr:phenylalanine--tRNA ligase subunit alpha [Patescibacteria group bacterium]MDD5716102.1 phenylalanine--tRNA ligase subunit alpha [Patescibacteria group bacterium]